MLNHQNLLQNVALFRGFRVADLEELTQNAIVHRYDADEVIFRQRDPGTTLYVIIKGEVEIYLQDATGQAIVLQTMERGDYFGELSLFDDKPRSASARALSAVELLEITQTQIADYITRYPRSALILLHTMAERLRATDEMLRERAAKNVDEELEKHLAWADKLADKVAALNGSWSFIILLLGLTVLWMVLNSSSLLGPKLDPYPYVFFNLLLAILVALQGPLIVMSQNRKALLERARAEADYHVNLKNEVNIEALLLEVKSLQRLLVYQQNQHHEHQHH
jgi:CRP/FNR family transcriptional regulator, cyclic AMP receptor protein